jgi:hypothetical protein
VSGSVISAAAGIVVAAVSVGAATATTGPRFDPCPPRGSMRAVYDAAAATDGAFHAIQRVFPTINYAQGRTPPVTRRTTLVREVVEMNRTSTDALYFRRLASRRCGPATALNSWAVVAQFPLSAMATTSQMAVFVVDTETGWKLYGAVLDHH